MSSKTIGEYIALIHRHNQTYMKHKTESLNLGYGQYIFILYLLKCDGISQNDLAKILSLDKGTIARSLKKLEETGYIQRKTDPNDKRVHRVYITDAGRKIGPEIKEILRERKSILLDGFTEEEINLLSPLLSKMTHNIITHAYSKEDFDGPEK